MYAYSDVLTPHFVHTNLPRGTADEINILIEVPKGTETGVDLVDRRLFIIMVYPCSYGLVPRTPEGHGDAVSFLMLGDYQVVLMLLIRATPVGVLLT
jgi:inorganic pyrophosphatase